MAEAMAEASPDPAPGMPAKPVATDLWELELLFFVLVLLAFLVLVLLAFLLLELLFFTEED